MQFGNKTIKKAKRRGVVQGVNGLLCRRFHGLLHACVLVMFLHFIDPAQPVISPFFKRNETLNEFMVLLGEMLLDFFGLFLDPLAGLDHGQDLDILELCFKNILLLLQLFGDQLVDEGFDFGRVRPRSGAKAV